MAIVESPLFTKLSGRIGNMIIYKWKNKIVIRTIPFEPKNPKTPGQLKQRQKFSLMTGLDKYLRAFTRKGFPEAEESMSQCNAFMKANIRTGSSGNYPDQQIDFPRLVVASGSLRGAEGATVNNGKGFTVKFEWNDNSGTGNARATDIAMALLINPVDQELAMDIKTCSRADRKLQLDVPSSWKGKQVYAYLSFSNTQGDKTADSLFLGAVKITEEYDSTTDNDKNETSSTTEISEKGYMPSLLFENMVDTTPDTMPQKDSKEKPIMADIEDNNLKITRHYATGGETKTKDENGPYRSNIYIKFINKINNSNVKYPANYITLTGGGSSGNGIREGDDSITDVTEQLSEVA